MTVPAIEVRNLRREFRVGQGIFAEPRRVVAVDDVSFAVPAGSVLGVVGESGCGKSTLARLILGLLEPSSGDVLVDGQKLAGMERRARARLIQPVFQDPSASLNPRRRIRDIVAMPLVRILIGGLRRLWKGLAFPLNKARASPLSFRAGNASVLRSHGLWYCGRGLWCVMNRQARLMFRCRPRSSICLRNCGVIWG